MSVWARPRVAQPNGAALIGQGAAAGYGPDYTLGLTGAGVPFTLNREGWAGGAYGPAAMAPGTWHHYTTVMFDNGVQLYVGGVPIQPNPAGFSYPCCYMGGSLRFGRQVSSFGGQFDGDLDDVRVERGALDGTTVASQFGAGRSTLTATTAPEPATAGLLAAGMGALGVAAWRRRAARG